MQGKSADAITIKVGHGIMTIPRQVGRPAAESKGEGACWSEAEKRLEMVGAAGFEPAASCSQGRRANQAALRPDVDF